MSVILQQNIINTLKTLAYKDSDLKSIVIALNPNYANGSDIQLKQSVREEINTMVKQGLIKKHNMDIRILIGRSNNYKYSHRIFTLYSLNTLNKTKF